MRLLTPARYPIDEPAFLLFNRITLTRSQLLEILYSGALTSIPVLLVIQRAAEWIGPALDWLQCAVILVVCVVINRDTLFVQKTLRQSSLTGPGWRQAGQATRQFLRYWKWLWLAWLLLYLIFGVTGSIEAWYGGIVREDHRLFVNLLANLVNNIQSLAILLLFAVMGVRTTGPSADILRLIAWDGFLAIALLSALEISGILWGSDGVRENGGLLASFISGSVSGVAFALLFSRLGSYHLPLRPLSLAILLLYATIQPLFPLFRLPAIAALANIEASPPTPAKALPASHVANVAIPRLPRAGVTNEPKRMPPVAPAPSAKHSVASTPPFSGLAIAKLTLKIMAGMMKLYLFFVVRNLLRSGRLTDYFHNVAHYWLSIGKARAYR